MLISTLENYYDIEKKEAFDDLFKGLWIHDNPTEERNSYLVLRLDFSGIETSRGKEDLYQSFNEKTKQDILSFLKYYAPLLQGEITQTIQNEKKPSMLIKTLSNFVEDNRKQIYLLIDEVDFLFSKKVPANFDFTKLANDNFANDLIGANEDNLYYDILSKTGFVRTFYETIKSGA